MDQLYQKISSSKLQLFIGKVTRVQRPDMDCVVKDLVGNPLSPYEILFSIPSMIEDARAYPMDLSSEIRVGDRVIIYSLESIYHNSFLYSKLKTPSRSSVGSHFGNAQVDLVPKKEGLTDTVIKSGECVVSLESYKESIHINSGTGGIGLNAGEGGIEIRNKKESLYNILEDLVDIIYDIAPNPSIKSRLYDITDRMKDLFDDIPESEYKGSTKVDSSTQDLVRLLSNSDETLTDINYSSPCQESRVQDLLDELITNAPSDYKPNKDLDVYSKYIFPVTSTRLDVLVNNKGTYRLTTDSKLFPGVDTCYWGLNIEAIKKDLDGSKRKRLVDPPETLLLRDSLFPGMDSTTDIYEVPVALAKSIHISKSYTLYDSLHYVGDKYHGTIKKYVYNGSSVISKTHSLDILRNAQYIVTNIMEVIKDVFSEYEPNLNSNYREENRGSKSQHEFGEAIDIQFNNAPSNGKDKATFYLKVAAWIYENLHFDQMIIEKSPNSVNYWIHVSLRRERPQRPDSDPLKLISMHGTTYGNMTPFLTPVVPAVNIAGKKLITPITK